MHRGKEAQRHRGTEAQRKRGKKFFPFVPLCLCPFAPFSKISNALEKQGFRDLGVRDLGKTASPVPLQPKPLQPKPLSLPLDPCHSSKPENSKAGADITESAAPSKLITFFKMSALLLIILGLSKATASFSKATEITESLTTADRNSVSEYGGIGLGLSNTAPTQDADSAPAIDENEDGESAQDQPQALDSALCIRDMDIKTLLKALALKHKVKIVSTPNVAGRISLNLNQTSLEDTLTAIARIMGLIWTNEGSIYILSRDNHVDMEQNSQKEGGYDSNGSENSAGIEVRDAEQNALRTTHYAPSTQETIFRGRPLCLPGEKTVIHYPLSVIGENTENGKLKTDNSLIQHEADPKSIKVFHVNYADLKELSKVIQWSFEKIRTTAYPQEGMILVEGDSKEVALVQGLIHSLDIPPRQALIEAQILEINLSDDMTYGIDWSGTFSQGHESSGVISSPGAVLPSDTSSGDASSQFLFGILKPHFYLKLSALEKKGDVKTLAKPRIMVLDGKSAQILIGGRLGYYLTTTTQTSTVQSVEFLDIGTQLKLIPHIAEDGNILMDIQPEVSDGSLSSGLPQKTTTSVSTSVMVKAGETIFIGGLIRNSEIKQRDRLPVLGHIPVLGKLFFSKASNQTQRKELVILLTPYLVPNRELDTSSQKAATSSGQGRGEGETGRRHLVPLSPCPPVPQAHSPPVPRRGPAPV